MEVTRNLRPTCSVGQEEEMLTCVRNLWSLLQVHPNKAVIIKAIEERYVKWQRSIFKICVLRFGVTSELLSYQISRVYLQLITRYQSKIWIQALNGLTFVPCGYFTVHIKPKLKEISYPVRPNFSTLHWMTVLILLLLLQLALQPLVCFGLIDNCPPGFSIGLIQ
jgi:hypothetical protein